MDGEGNAVSLIESNYGGFGSGVVDPATGIGYQNRGSYFSLDDDHPNVLAPGKRTLHTLMPGMLFRDGRPWVVVGSMGGDAQPQIHAQIVSSLVDGGVDVATAVAAPRWFADPETHFAPPDLVRAEPRFRAGIARRAGGHGPPGAAGRALRFRARPLSCDRTGRGRPDRSGRQRRGRDRSAQHGSAGDLVGLRSGIPLSAGPPAVAVVYTRPPVAGCAHDPLATGTPIPRRGVAQ